MLRLRRLVFVMPIGLLVACGGGESQGGGETAGPTPAEVTVTVTAEPPESDTTAETETETVTETVTITAAADTAEPVDGGATGSSASGSTDAGAGAEETETGETVVVPPQNRPLGLHDFFNVGQDWEEGRWNVATRSNLQGIAIAGNLMRPRELELRLQNQFSLLSFEAGQANDSISSECTTKIDIIVDGELRETREFGFNKIQDFPDIDVAGGNSVRIAVGSTGCSDSVRVVLSNINVE